MEKNKIKTKKMKIQASHINYETLSNCPKYYQETSEFNKSKSLNKQFKNI